MKLFHDVFSVLLFASLVVSCAGVPRGRTTEVHTAAAGGDVIALKSLLSGDADVNARDEKGRTALHYTAAAGNLRTTAALLNAGADPNLTDARGRTPLHDAVQTCIPDLVAMLLGGDADPLISDRENLTALDLAMLNDCQEVAQTIGSAL